MNRLRTGSQQRPLTGQSGDADVRPLAVKHLTRRRASPKSGFAKYSPIIHTRPQGLLGKSERDESPWLRAGRVVNGLIQFNLPFGKASITVSAYGESGRQYATLAPPIVAFSLSWWDSNLNSGKARMQNHLAKGG